MFSPWHNVLEIGHLLRVPEHDRMRICPELAAPESSRTGHPIFRDEAQSGVSETQVHLRSDSSSLEEMAS